MEYFGGDAEAVREKSPKKVKSFVKLCERAEDDTEWSVGLLRAALVAEVAAASLRPAVANELKWTCLWLLYRVRDLAVRRRLAERIVRGELYGRAAKDAIRAAAGEQRGGGPRPKPGVVRFFSRVTDMIERFRAEHSFDPETLRALPEGRRRTAIEEGEALAKQIAGIVAELKATRR